MDDYYDECCCSTVCTSYEDFGSCCLEEQQRFEMKDLYNVFGVVMVSRDVLLGKHTLT